MILYRRLSPDFERKFVIALATVQAHKNVEVLLKAFSDPALDALKRVLVGATIEAGLRERAIRSLAVGPEIRTTSLKCLACKPFDIDAVLT
jgi:hypothetical protein